MALFIKGPAGQATGFAPDPAPMSTAPDSSAHASCSASARIFPAPIDKRSPPGQHWFGQASPEPD
jgi:hypothetical protein